MNKPFQLCFKAVAVAVLWVGVQGTSVQGQSLWKKESSRSMVADKRATSVGDILTIVVQENNTASKDQNTSTSKSSGIDAAI